MALEDVPPGETLLSVPLDSVFNDIQVSQPAPSKRLHCVGCQGQRGCQTARFAFSDSRWGLQTDKSSHLSWAGRMALRLLDLKYKCAR